METPNFNIKKDDKQIRLENKITAFLKEHGWDEKAPNAEAEKEKILRRELGVNRITTHERLQEICNGIERRSHGPMGYGYTHLSVATDKKWAENIRNIL